MSRTGWHLLRLYRREQILVLLLWVGVLLAWARDGWWPMTALAAFGAAHQCYRLWITHRDSPTVGEIIAKQDAARMARDPDAG